jgi:imidazole glycerol-phosphate synthase subunit HisH
VTLRVAVLDYEAGNVRSAKRGFEAAGAKAFVTGDPLQAQTADALVVPGVGHWVSCLVQLRRSGLEPLLRLWIADARPLFGICVGMQLLYAASEEGDEPGLGLLPGEVRRFAADTVVPHLGWDVVQSAAGHEHDPLLAGIAGERLYFTHSFYAVPADSSHVVGHCRYGGAEFPCLVREGSVVGTQFHPEKSGEIGRRLLVNWLVSVERSRVC